MGGSSFTYTLCWLKLGQAPEAAVLPYPQVPAVCSQLHSFIHADKYLCGHVGKCIRELI